jgi:hypothetical protein
LIGSHTGNQITLNCWCLSLECNPATYRFAVKCTCIFHSDSLCYYLYIELYKIQEEIISLSTCCENLLSATSCSIDQQRPGCGTQAHVLSLGCPHLLVPIQAHLSFQRVIALLLKYCWEPLTQINSSISHHTCVR